MAIGVSISDVIYVAILYFGLSQLIEDPQFKIYLAFGGGIVLLLFGAYYIFLKNRRTQPLNKQDVVENKFYKHLLKGLVLNGLSPMVPIFWIGAISIATIDFGYQRGMDFIVFFFCVLLTVLSTDVLKAFLAGKLRALISPRFMKLINVIVGVFLVFFGGRLLYLMSIPT